VKKHPNSVKLNVLYSNELISTITKKNNQLPVTEISKNIILAKEHLKKAFLIDSSYYNISNSLGFIEMSILNNPNEALFWLKKSHKYNPNKFETNLNLGLCYEKLNLQDSTIAYFNKALIIKPNDKNLNIYYPNYLKSINRTDLLHNTVTK
jgi:tetratricopeptide (TPR) repeat protein